MATNPIKLHYTYTQKDFHKTYKKKSDNPVPWKQYQAFIRDFFIEVIKKVIFDREIFKFPHNMGYLILTSRKIPIKSRPFNWNDKKPDGTYGRHLSKGTDGRFFSLKWRKSNKGAKIGKMYIFKLSTSKHMLREGMSKVAIRDYVHNTLKNKKKLYH